MLSKLQIEAFHKIANFTVMAGYVLEGEDPNTAQVRPGYGPEQNQLPMNRFVTFYFDYSQGDLFSYCCTRPDIK